MDWQGNVTMQLQLGTAFWLFLVVAIAVLVLWFTGYLSKVTDAVMNSFR
jgi:type VI protein secretion system component VasF